MTQKEIWEKVYAKAWELNGGTDGFIEGMARYGLKMAGMETPTITTPAVPEQMVLEGVKKETTPDRYTRAGVHIVLRNKSGMKIDFKNAAVASEWIGRSSGYIMDRIRCGDAIYSRTEDG